MRHQVQIDAYARRVEVTFRGPVSYSDRIEILRRIAPDIARGLVAQSLLDYTRAWVGEAGLEAYKELSSRLCNAQQGLRGMKCALVNPPDFHAIPTEEVADMVGIKLRRFYSREAAIAWLERD